MWVPFAPGFSHTLDLNLMHSFLATLTENAHREEAGRNSSGNSTPRVEYSIACSH